MDYIRVTKVPGVRLEKGQRTYTGTLHLLAHFLLFRVDDSDGEIWISYSTIQSADRKFPTPAGLHPICITCRHFLFVKLFIARERDATDVFASLQRLMNVSSIEQLYAFSYKPVKPYTSTDGWRMYDPIKEFERLGVGSRTDQWRFTQVNQQYEFCPTYPRYLVVPSKISDNVLRYTAKFRSKGRIPALSYLHRTNMASITRSSQPMVGLKQNRSIQDEKLVEAIFTSTCISTIDPTATINLIIDARPTANAMAQTALGAGTESVDHYHRCRIAYLGIDNIHVVRDSMGKLLEAVNSVESGPVPRALLDKSGWLKHVRNILDGTLSIVQHIHLQNSHVLVHCSDGWDRTAQLCSLAEICLDPYYRTIKGFAVLLEKEWVSFGHKFRDRCGHLSRDHSITSDRSSVGAQLQAARRNVSNSITSAAKSFLSKNQITIGGLSFGGGGGEGSTSSSVDGSPNGSSRSISYPGGYAASALNPITAHTSSHSSSPPSSHPLTSSEISTPNHIAPREVAPIFTQFLDCVYQLWTQFPTHFEFSEKLLSTLNLHVYSCQFGNFIFNNEREKTSFRYRGYKRVEEAAFSIWDYVEANREEYVNPHYVPLEMRKAKGGDLVGAGMGSVVNGTEGTPGSTSAEGDVLYPSTANLRYWVGLCLREEETEMGKEVVDEVADAEQLEGTGIQVGVENARLAGLNMSNPWETEEVTAASTMDDDEEELDTHNLSEPGDESEAEIMEAAKLEPNGRDSTPNTALDELPQVHGCYPPPPPVKPVPIETEMARFSIGEDDGEELDYDIKKVAPVSDLPHPLWDPEVG